MYTIFEQGQAEGIGHSVDTFKRRFVDICDEHIKTKKAKAFAFIFYDFEDSALKKTLKEQGVFTQLDRLSGYDLSVFYLHSNNKDVFTDFNDTFLEAFEIKSNFNLPFVLFFRLTPDKIVKDIEVVELEQTKPIYAFQELYGVIETYMRRANKKSGIKSVALNVIKFVGDKFIDVVIAKLMSNN